MFSLVLMPGLCEILFFGLTLSTKVRTTVVLTPAMESVSWLPSVLEFNFQNPVFKKQNLPNSCLCVCVPPPFGKPVKWTLLLFIFLGFRDILAVE